MFSKTYSYIQVIYLIYACVLSIFSILIISPSFNGGIYVNKITLILGLALTLTDLFFLRISKFKNAFILILAFFTFHGIILRILSLSYFQSSHGLNRFGDITSSDPVNLTLLLIFLFNITSYYFSRKNNFRIERPNNEILKFNDNVILLFFAILFLYNFSNSDSAFTLGLNFRSIISNFLRPGVYLGFLITYLFYIRFKINKFTLLMYALFFIVYLVFSIINGNRGELYSFFVLALFNIFLCGVANYKIKFKHLFTFLFFCFLSLQIFSVATFFRFFQNNENANLIAYSSSDEVIHNLPGRIDYLSIKRGLNEASSNYSNASFYSTAQAASERLGFLDYACDIIYHADLYRKYLNFSSYFKSVVDNILTPGFDYFNFPMIKNLISMVYSGRSIISKSDVSSNYQSDMMTMYGEFYILFGFFSFLLIPVYIIALKKACYDLVDKFSSKYVKYNIRIYALIFYFNTLIGFGFDQVLFNCLIFLICFSIFFYLSRGKIFELQS